MKSGFLTAFLAGLLYLSLVGSSGNAMADDTHRLYNLCRDWKFELGDNQRWADPKFDDSRWSEIEVPSSWEEEGYPGYDGYAWYRIHFTALSDWESNDLFLDLGAVDDVDETYLNGQLIGTMGGFPPNYSTAYNFSRHYPIPYDLLRPNGDNVIAVRVYDNQGSGGIISGRIGIYENRYSVDSDLRLPAVWKFKTGDEAEWKEESYDDKDWKNVRVPAYWETQGFRDYDGYAWYRVKFKVPSSFSEQDLIALVGKIDDFDETYLNGVRIGHTGYMPTTPVRRTDSDEYTQLRAYMIPSGVVHFDKDNVLAVRVYDCWQGGGLYEGPIGLVTRQHYAKYHRAVRNFGRWFEDLIDRIFN
ncbi:MAG TPA: beta galactosidase jelly roll domain-containing protein [Candidatus Kryptonia bacterium]